MGMSRSIGNGLTVIGTLGVTTWWSYLPGMTGAPSPHSPHLLARSVCIKRKAQISTLDRRRIKVNDRYFTSLSSAEETGKAFMEDKDDKMRRKIRQNVLFMLLCLISDEMLMIKKCLRRPASYLVKVSSRVSQMKKWNYRSQMCALKRLFTSSTIGVPQPWMLKPVLFGASSAHLQ